MEKPKLLYLTSAKYSGSTLFSLVLGAQAGVSTIGERRKFYSKVIEPTGPARHCSCGKLFVECPYWTGLREDYHALRRKEDGPVPHEFSYFRFFTGRYPLVAYRRAFTHLISSGFVLDKLPFTGRFRSLLRENEYLIQAALARDGNRVFFDSSKPVEHGVFFTASEVFDTYLIWLIRDPRAQCVSAIRYNDWTLEEAARQWIKFYRQAARHLTRGYLRVHKVSYEAFCQDPKSILAGINDFAGLGIEHWNLDYRNPTAHVMGNGGTRHGDGPSVIEERLGWVDKISSAERRKLERQLAEYTEYFSPRVPVL